MGAAEQQKFSQYPYQYGDGLRGAALAQTRNGKDELITPIAFWELDAATGLYMPPGMSSNPRKPRVEATLTGRILPPPIIRINSDTVIPPGANYHWDVTSSERDILDRWPIFAVIVALKFGTSGTYNLNLWQYLPYHENFSNPIPPENSRLDPWPSPVTNQRILVARVRRFPTAITAVRVSNAGSSDIVVSNLLLQCLEV